MNQMNKVCHTKLKVFQHLNLFIVIILFPLSINSQQKLKIEMVDVVVGSSAHIIDILTSDKVRYYSLSSNQNFTVVHRSDDLCLNWKQMWFDDYVWGIDSITGKDTLLHIPQKVNFSMFQDTSTLKFYTDSTIMETTDAGLSWRWRPTNLKQNLFSHDISGNGFFAGISSKNRNLFLTNNYGNSWKEINGDSLELGKTFFNGVKIINDSILFLVSSIFDTTLECTLYKSSNFGKSWDNIKLPGTAYSDKIEFCNYDIGWVESIEMAGYNYLFTRILKTTDSGKTWKIQLDSILRGLFCIKAFDSLNVIAVNDSLAYITTDGGEHWNIYDCPNYGSKTKIIYLSKTSWLLANMDAGVVFRLSLETDNIENLLFSENNLYLYPNPATDFLEISFPEHALKDVAILMYNVFGEEVLATSYFTPSPSPKERGVRIDVSGLSPGIYFIRVGDKVGKFVKI